MAEQTSATAFQPIAQMTIKKLGADPKDAVRKDTTVFLCRIYGEATAKKTKEARSGDVYSYLVGEFRAENAAGEKFESEKLFLPASIQESVESQLSAAEGKAVQFGYEIFSGPDDKVSVGYRYAARAIFKTQASDRLAQMTAALGKMDADKPKAEAAAVPAKGKK